MKYKVGQRIKNAYSLIGDIVQVDGNIVWIQWDTFSSPFLYTDRVCARYFELVENPFDYEVVEARIV